MTISCKLPKILLQGFLGEGMSGSIHRQTISLPPPDPGCIPEAEVTGDLMYLKKAPAAGLEAAVAAAAEATAA